MITLSNLAIVLNGNCKRGPEPSLAVLQYKVNSCWNQCKHCDFQPHSKISLTSRGHMVLISDIKLIRTDTTL